jgi:anti-anti-sigma factor
MNSMFQVSENQGTIQFNISSEMLLVDRVVSAAKEYLAQFGVTHLADVNVVMRELLINAIEHGNGKDRTKSVTCQIANLGGARFQITIEDQGTGFDHASKDLTMPKPGASRSRGLALINSFTDQLEFNDQGNRVTAYMTIINPTGFPVDVIDDVTVIAPTGDLTAACADDFRQLLLRESDAGKRRFRFDLGSVRDLDSVSLSVLVAFAQLLRSTGQSYTIELINCSPDLLNLFRLTRIDHDFTITMKGR